MDSEVLKVVGQVAGIGGVALGVFLLLFRDIIRLKIFPELPPAEAYRLLRLITIAVWSVAVIGIGAWILVTLSGKGTAQASDCAIAINGNVSDSTVTNTANCPDGKKGS